MNAKPDSRRIDPCRTRQLITFDVIGRRYGVPRESVVAVVPLEDVDITTDHARGRTPHRNAAMGRWLGRTLPIVDPRKAEQTSKPARAGRVLIALRRANGDAVGIAADRLASVVTYDIDQVQPSPGATPSPLGAVRTRVLDGAGHAIDCIDPAGLGNS